MPSQRALIILASAYALSFAAGGIQVPHATPAMRALGFSLTGIGMMWAARNFMQVLAPPVWGLLADRHGSGRPFAMASLVLGGIVLASVGHVTTEQQAILLFALFGVLGAPSATLLDGIVLTALGDKKREFGRWRFFGTLGFGVAALVSSLSIYWGFLPATTAVLFPICGCLTIAGGLAMLFCPPVPRARLASTWDVIGALKAPGLPLLLLMAMLHWASHSAYSGFLVPLAEARGAASWSVGVAISLAICVELVAMRVTSSLVDRFGTHRVLIAVSALAVVRWTLLAVTTGTASYIALHALHGLTFGIFFPTLVSAVAARVPESARQAAQGVLASLVLGFGSGLGSITAGVVFDHAGATGVWISQAVLAAAGLACAITLARRHGHAARPAH